MALQNYVPAAADAQGLARVFETASEEEFSVFDPEYATAKHIYKPMCDEILALISRNYGRNRYGAVISPSISGDQNDYAPTGYATATRIRITATGAGRTITGFTAGSDGDIITFENVGALFVTFANQSASSSAANRFALGGLGTATNPNISIWTNDTVSFVYDATTARWRLIASNIAKPTFGVYPSGTTSCTSGADTLLTMNTEEWDSHGWFDNATNYRYTPLLPGKYLFCWLGTISSTPATAKRFRCSLRKNGSVHKAGPIAQSSVADAVGSAGSAIVTMNGSSDYVDVSFFHDNGSSLNVGAGPSTTFFNGIRVGD